MPMRGASVRRSRAGARARLEQRAKQLDADLGAKKLELTNCQTKLSRILESRLARETENEDRQRMLRLAGRTRETRGEFLERATQQKIDRPLAERSSSPATA